MVNKWWKAFAAVLLAAGLGFGWSLADRHAFTAAPQDSKAAADDKKAPPGAPSVEVSDEHQRVLKETARYLYGVTSPITDRLDQLGYTPPPALAPRWGTVPDYQKLHYAYLAAVNADPQQGGERFLALMSADLSRRHHVAGGLLARHAKRGDDDQAIADYLRWKYGPDRPDGPPPPPPVAFKNPEPDKPPPAVPPGAKNVLRAIERYSTAGVLPWSERTILLRFFKATPERADELLLTQPTFFDALLGAMGDRPAEDHPTILKKIVTAVYQEYPLIEDHPVLSRWIDFNPPELGGSPARRGPPDDSPPPRPKAPARAAEDVTAEQRYERSRQETYKESKDRDFKEMGTKVKDFGGGVLGNTITAKDLPKPLRMRFEPGGGNTGTLHFACEGGRDLRYPLVRAEDAWAAAQIVFAGGWKPGEGIGLVGQKEVGLHWVFGRDGIRVLRKSEVVLHPALVDTELGHAALAVDSAPGQAFRAWLRVLSQGPTVVHEQIEKWVTSHEKVLTSSSYVFTDVPVELTESDGLLLVTASPENAAKLPLTLRRSAFVELRLQTAKDAANPEDRYDRVFAREFYRVVPVLEKASYDLRRVNHFAAVVALVRWAREQGVAHCEGLSDEKPRAQERTPDALVEEFPPATDNQNQVAELARSLNGPRRGMKEPFAYTPIRPVKEADELQDRARRAAEALGQLRKRQAIQAFLDRAGDEWPKALDDLRKEAKDDARKAAAAVAKSEGSKEFSKDEAREVLDLFRLAQFAALAAQLERQLGNRDVGARAQLRSWFLLNYAKMRFEAEAQTK
jgi:hypothetical protein